MTLTDNRCNCKPMDSDRAYFLSNLSLKFSCTVVRQAPGTGRKEVVTRQDYSKHGTKGILYFLCKTSILQLIQFKEEMTQKSEMQWRNVLEIHSKIYCNRKKKLTTSFFDFWKRNSYAIEVENLLEVNSILMFTQNCFIFAKMLQFSAEVFLIWMNDCWVIAVDIFSSQSWRMLIYLIILK